MTSRILSVFLMLAIFGCAVSAFAADKAISDDLIYDNVKRKLATDSNIKGGGLDIDVKQGVVTLKGKVEYEKQKVKAERVAKKVRGVKSVVNEITIGRN